MKKAFLSLIILMISNSAFSQVGINNKNPQATLDVTSKKTDGTTPEGIIAPRLTGNQLKLADAKYGIEQTGTLIYCTARVEASSAKTINVTSAGYYYFTGTVWLKLMPQFSEYVFSDFITIPATAPVSYPPIASNAIVNNINLGLQMPITVPANSTVKVQVSYSVPIGAIADDFEPASSGYYGIRMVKDGTEIEIGSRKSSMLPLTANSGARMTTVTGLFSEVLVNNTATDNIVIYDAQGYLEYTNFTVRFNMASLTPPNYNWGRATINATTYIKRN